MFAMPSVPPAISAASGPRIEVRATSAGKLLTDGAGLVLFAFSKDSRNIDRCAPVRSCASVWPIVSTHGTPSAGPSVKHSLVGTIHVHGKSQVTYAGHPLYRYSAEPTPGATDYIGANLSGGIWRGIRSNGALVG